MLNYLWAPFTVVLIDLFLRLFFCLSVIRRRLPVGVAWAWISLILLLPVLGTLLYLYIGEYRLGARRMSRLMTVTKAISQQMQTLCEGRSNEMSVQEPGQSLALSVRSFFKSPVLMGNDVRLLGDADATFAVLIDDIDKAQRSCDMEFYIWSDNGRADQVAEALIRARGRGVDCRILVDDIGSRPFLRGKLARRLRSAGVQIQAALPLGLLRSLFSRPDLRMHRKIIIIDGSIGYTGSLNMADPLYFHRSANVGPWVDAFCRIQGPAVRALHLVLLSDWSVETGLDLATLERNSPFLNTALEGRAKIQCIPSAPALESSTIEEILIVAIYSARNRLVLTTPYFLPSESLLYALVAAARRGVDVSVIVPAKVDSWLIQHASRALLKDLLEAGVKVALYQAGMLHTKSLVVDETYSIFGSLNIDPRSLRINFEICLGIFDEVFARSLGELQDKYLQQSIFLVPGSDLTKNRLTLLKENLSRLASPLL